MKHIFKISLFAIVLCVSVAQAKDQKFNIYWQELKDFKQAEEYKKIFDKDNDLPVGVAQIYSDIENYQQLSFTHRLLRFMFFMLDVVVVTPQSMPKLYAYVDSLCTQAGMNMPTIFVTREKWLFNAAACKLFTSTGGIVIGQEIMKKSSTQEIEAVVAHEIGHIKHNHTNKILAMNASAFILINWLTHVACRFLLDSQSSEDESIKAAMIKLGTQWTTAAIITTCIINKRFEKEADEFAFKMGKAKGLQHFFEDAMHREKEQDKELMQVSTAISAHKAKVSSLDYAILNIEYGLTKFNYTINKVMHWIYGHTPLGEHPSNEARVKAAKEYIKNNEGA